MSSIFRKIHCYIHEKMKSVTRFWRFFSKIWRRSPSSRNIAHGSVGFDVLAALSVSLWLPPPAKGGGLGIEKGEREHMECSPTRKTLLLRLHDECERAFDKRPYEEDIAF